MLILSIRTDKPEAEIGLFEDEKQLEYSTWQAHRQLAETIHLKIEALLHSTNHSIADIQAIAVFKGPGSFTGLRIGCTVANALADALQIPILATDGEAWIRQAQKRLLEGESDKIALPEYGAPPHITIQKK